VDRSKWKQNFSNISNAVESLLFADFVGKNPHIKMPVN